MNLSVTKGPIGISELVYSTTAEQAIECDVMLPDYCPDMVRILCCEADVVQSSLSHHGQRLTLDGTVGLTVLYQSAEGGVRRTEYKLPFSHSMDLKSADEGSMVTAVADLSYINCRAVGPRRLDVRGAIAIGVKVWAQKEEEAVVAAEGEGIQLKLKEMEACRVVGRLCLPLRQTEDLDLPQNTPAPTAVLRATGSATISECRALDGRVVLKGEIALRICYTTDETGRHTDVAEYLLPLSQIADAPAAREGASCTAALRVCGVDVELGEDMAGESVFTVEVHMLAFVHLCENMALQLATDCYSTRYPCEGKKKPVPVAGSGYVAQERKPYKATLNVGEDLEQINCLWARPQKVSCQTTAEGSQVTGMLRIGILGQTADGVDFRERQTDFTLPLPQRVGRDFTPEVGVTLPEGSLSGIGEMELECDIWVVGAASDGATMEVLTDIALTDDRPFEADPAVGIRIYYAQPGESVWDIAKRYHVAQGRILEDNELSSDTLSARRALIIPTV
jgi:hypothetical protein